MSEPPALSDGPPPLRVEPPPPAGRRGPGRARLAWLGLLAAGGAMVGYSAWRAGGDPLGTGSEPVAAAGPFAPEAPQDPSGPWPDPLVSLYETRADAARPIKLKFSIIDPRRAASRVRSAKPKPVGTVTEVTPPPRPSTRWPSRPATLPPTLPVAINPGPAVKLASAAPAATPAPPRPTTPAPTRSTTPAPAAIEPRRSPEEVRPPAAAPAAAAAPAVARVELPGEEERIRTTLARFRSAYSQLDASAAREVWPSVDVRALERAFDGLKSQELRFDRCSFTVDGPRAKAACTGRAVYVPRIGNQSPRSTPREWTFELRKAEDERWTIASARSS